MWRVRAQRCCAKECRLTQQATGVPHRKDGITVGLATSSARGCRKLHRKSYPCRGSTVDIMQIILLMSSLASKLI